MVTRSDPAHNPPTMADTSWMIYGANGYTGALAAREAVRRGESPILAGRNRQKLETLATELGLELRSFGLGDNTEIRSALEGVSAVLHCAGPFVRTSRVMVDACLHGGCHYLDITGEIAVFEAVLARGTAAREAGLALLPGVGMDVVPTDCVAARLAEALPDARELELAFHSRGGELSRGTLTTMIEGLPGKGAVRRAGRIVPVPVAWDAREIDFSCGPRWAMTIPWGDVSTAFHTTGIPDIRVYAATSLKAIRRIRRMAPLLPVAGLRPVKRLLQWRIGKTVVGPDADVRERARVHVWGRATNSAGESRTTTLDTPEGYSLTAATAVDATLRVVAGEVSPGAWTPARAFGTHYIDGFPGVTPGEILDGPAG